MPKVAVPHFRFRVTDVLTSTAPLRDLVIGRPPTREYVYSTHAHRPDFELVGVSGEGLDGALCVLHRHVRPLIDTSFDMGDVVDVWTIGVDSSDNLMEYHRYLFLAKVDRTLILDSSETLQELEHTQFYTGPTVAVAVSSGMIIQVFDMGVGLFELDGRKVGVWDFDQVVMARIGVRFVALLLADESLVLLKLEDRTLKVLTIIEVRFSEGFSNSKYYTICSHSCSFAGRRCIGLCPHDRQNREIYSPFSYRFQTYTHIATTNNTRNRCRPFGPRNPFRDEPRRHGHGYGRR